MLQNFIFASERCWATESKWVPIHNQVTNTHWSVMQMPSWPWWYCSTPWLHWCTAKVRACRDPEFLAKLFVILNSVLCLRCDLPTLKATIDDVNGQPKPGLPTSFSICFTGFPFPNNHVMDWGNTTWWCHPKPQRWLKCKNRILR